MTTDHPHTLGPGLRSRLDLPELAARLGGVDLVAVDIDECIFPGFSQSWLGYLIMAQLLTRPERAGDLRCVPQLLSGGAYSRKVALLRRLGHRGPANRALMARYVQSMRGIPEGYFRRGARRIPRWTFAGVARCLTLLGRRAPLGLISFGIDPITEAYRRWLDQRGGGAVVAFCESNRVAFVPGADGRPVFSDYLPPLSSGPADKLRALERRLADHGAACPLVIGNGRDETAMADLARQRGGISIAFRPPPAHAGRFDLVISAGDWEPLAALVRDLLTV